MIWETLAAHPSTWSACAIGSDLFTATMLAHVLLKPCHRGAIPLPITVKFRMVRSSHQLINQRDTLQSCCRLLRRNPAVPDELSCQTPTEYNKCWAASNRTFCESKYRRARNAFTSEIAKTSVNTRVSHRWVIQESSTEGKAWRRLL